MGVPLYQCEQTYTFMAPQLKCVFQNSIIHSQRYHKVAHSIVQNTAEHNTHCLSTSYTVP